jgi:high-affinity nickel-transport protein
LLATAGAAAAGGLPWYAILCLPVMFAAGMSLLDTIDGAFMNFAYGWAFSQPVRKVFYNITVTALSVAVALLIGMIELLGGFADSSASTGGVFGWAPGLDSTTSATRSSGLFVRHLDPGAGRVAVRAASRRSGRPGSSSLAPARRLT